MFIKDPATRQWIYGILAAAGAVAVVYGLITQDQLAVWLTLGAALLGSNGLALANVDKGKHEA